MSSVSFAFDSIPHFSLLLSIIVTIITLPPQASTLYLSLTHVNIFGFSSLSFMIFGQFFLIFLFGSPHISMVNRSQKVFGVLWIVVKQGLFKRLAWPFKVLEVWFLKLLLMAGINEVNVSESKVHTRLLFLYCSKFIGLLFGILWKFLYFWLINLVGLKLLLMKVFICWEKGSDLCWKFESSTLHSRWSFFVFIYFPLFFYCSDLLSFYAYL